MSRSFAGMAAVAGVLILLVLVFANPFQDSIRKDNPKPRDLWDGTVVDGADRIELATAGEVPTVLSREGGSWVVESKGAFPADTTAVGNMLRAIRNARSMGIASTNPGNQSKFQVDASGVRVSVSGGGETLVQFTLGKIGKDFTTSYVLPEGSGEVHTVRGVNRNLFSRPQGFRDRTLFRFDPARIRAVALSSPDGDWEAARGDTAWGISRPGGSPEPVNQTELDTVIRSLSNLSADGFAEGTVEFADTGVESPDYTITVKFDGGEESEIQVGKRNESNQFYARRPGRDAVYLLGEWRINGLAKKYEDLVQGE